MKDGTPLLIRRASRKDGESLRSLYYSIYGEDYPLETIKDDRILAATLSDYEKYFWLILENDRKDAVGSVIFATDKSSNLAKVFGAVIRPDYQGNDLMRQMISKGRDHLLQEGAPFEILYATTRTVTLAPQKLTQRLGFNTLGIFPNVRKVKKYETHGLSVYFRKGALAKRIHNPPLIPEVRDFYEITRELLDLEDEPTIAEIPHHDLEHSTLPTLRFETEDDEESVKRRYVRLKEEGKLAFCFFPFHEAQLRIYTEGNETEVFLHFNRYDRYGCILGIKSYYQDLCGLLHQICHASREFGFKYIELLVSAFEPHAQRAAFEAGFLPCAYFPAMKPALRNKREDYIVFSRSYERLDFTNIELTGSARLYLDAFMKCWYWHLLKRSRRNEDFFFEGEDVEE